MKNREINNQVTKDDIFRVLKGALLADELSLMVGAGFSKNASETKYKDWKELVGKMIPDAFPYECGHFELHKEANPQLSENSLNDMLINQYGYLGVAQKYVDNKGGLHQYIDRLIEESTHKIDYKTGCIPEDIDTVVHEKLLDLKVKTIYTFNYDNLLEAVAHCKFTSEEYSQLNKYKALEDNINECLNLLHRSNTSNYDFNKVHELENDISLSQYKVPLKKTIELVEELGIVEFSTQSLKEEDLVPLLDVTRDKLQQIEFELKERSYHTVNNRNKLSISSKKGQIIKLHGSYDDDQLAFDTSVNEKYIITEEDYKDYPIKHEPFTRLMQIALLKDKILAVGFSGDDPNFLSWVNWVTSVLRNTEEIPNEDAKRQLESAKVFLVDVSKDEIDEAKMQYYKENRIWVIKLSDFYKSEQAKDLISLFLDDLRVYRAEEVSNFIISSDKFDKLKSKDCFLNQIDNYYEFNQLSVLYYTSRYITSCKRICEGMQRLSKTLEWANYMVHLLYVYGQPLEMVLDESDVRFIDDSMCQSMYTNLVIIWKVLRMKTITGEINSHLFSLDFGKANKLLSKQAGRTHFDSYEIVRIDALNSLLNNGCFQRISFKDIKIHDMEKSIIESICYTYCKDDFTTEPKNDGNDRLSFKDILEIMKQNLYSINFPIPYDTELYRIQGRDDRVIHANLLLNSMSRLGITTSNGHKTFVESSVLYACFKLLYKESTYKMIFYVLTADDKEVDLIKKCAQEILYNLPQDKINEIILKLIDAYPHTHKRRNIRRNILVLIIELTNNSITEQPNEVFDFVKKELVDKSQSNVDLNLARYLFRVSLYYSKVIDEKFAACRKIAKELNDSLFLVYSVLDRNINAFDENDWRYSYVNSVLKKKNNLNSATISNIISLSDDNACVQKMLVDIFEERIKKKQLHIDFLTALSKLSNHSRIITNYIEEKLNKWDCSAECFPYYDEWQCLVDIDLDNCSFDVYNNLICQFELFIQEIRGDADLSTYFRIVPNHRLDMNKRYTTMISIACKIKNRVQNETNTFVLETNLLSRANKIIDEFVAHVGLLNNALTLDQLLHSSKNNDVAIAIYYLNVFIGHKIESQYAERMMQAVLVKLIDKNYLWSNLLYKVVHLYCRNVCDDDWDFKHMESKLIRALIRVFLDETQNNILLIDKGEKEWEYNSLSKMWVIKGREVIEKALNILTIKHD